MSDWFKDWFSSGEYHTVYKHRDSKDVVQFWNTFTKKFNPQKEIKILDAACGPGRYSVFLAEKGFDVTGFDLAMPLLKITGEKLTNLGIQPKLFRSDIRNVPLKGKFDLILNMFTSFGYFDDEDENFRFIDSARNLMGSHSIFVLDYLNEHLVRKNLVPHSQKKIGDKSITENRFIRNGRVEKEITIAGKEGSVNFLESVKLYDKDFMLTKIKDLGYNVREVWGGYEGEPFDRNSSQRLIILFSL
ncbi:MAG: methyltransferase [Melioribacteraceae bacterium]|nr:MAG: methyltransferase [Melioribacteraceae bacterium]